MFHTSLLSGLKTRVESSKDTDMLFQASRLLPDTLSSTYGIYSIKDDRVEGIDNKFWKPIRFVNYAGLIMIRGLTKNFTQPIGYFLTSSWMKSFIACPDILITIELANNTGASCICDG